MIRLPCHSELFSNNRTFWNILVLIPQQCASVKDFYLRHVTHFIHLQMYFNVVERETCFFFIIIIFMLSFTLLQHILEIRRESILGRDDLREDSAT